VPVHPDRSRRGAAAPVSETRSTLRQAATHVAHAGAPNLTACRSSIAREWPAAPRVPSTNVCESCNVSQLRSEWEGSAERPHAATVQCAWQTKALRQVRVRALCLPIHRMLRLQHDSRRAQGCGSMRSAGARPRALFVPVGRTPGLLGPHRARGRTRSICACPGPLTPRTCKFTGAKAASTSSSSTGTCGASWATAGVAAERTGRAQVLRVRKCGRSRSMGRRWCVRARQRVQSAWCSLGLKRGCGAGGTEAARAPTAPAPGC